MHVFVVACVFYRDMLWQLHATPAVCTVFRLFWELAGFDERRCRGVGKRGGEGWGTGKSATCWRQPTVVRLLACCCACLLLLCILWREKVCTAGAGVDVGCLLRCDVTCDMFVGCVVCDL